MIDILPKAEKLFNAKITKLIGGFSNNVYLGISNGEEIVIKIYSTKEYQIQAIKAEINWILYLLKSDINVTGPICSINNNYLEELDNEYFALAFEKAKGQIVDITDYNQWNSDLFIKWGKTLGSIHKLSINYQNNQFKKQWNQGMVLENSSENIDPSVIDKWHQYLKVLDTLPKDKQVYGMIHNDLHHQNFHVYNNDIILFDFGDCEYNWYVYDIAIVIYHAVQADKRSEFANEFIKNFLKGYLSINDIENQWILKIPFFLNYRRIYSYIYLNQFLTDKQKSNLKEYLLKTKINIITDIDYIHSDFSQIIAKL